MSTLPSNEFKDLLARKVIDFANDTFKGILMEAGFAFDRANHDVYADVSGQELPTAFGYTVGGITLSGVSITRNDTTNKVTITWNNASWTATGGDITAQGLLIFDDTVASPVVDPVIGFIDFGSPLTAYDTGNLVVTNVGVEY
jgi:predicted porin